MQDDFICSRHCQHIRGASDSLSQVGNTSGLHLDTQSWGGEENISSGLYRKCLIFNILICYLQFPHYELREPNDCNFNFIQIFDEKTDIEHRKRNFCGSVAESFQSESDVLFIRYKQNFDPLTWRKTVLLSGYSLIIFCNIQILHLDHVLTSTSVTCQLQD